MIQTKCCWLRLEHKKEGKSNSAMYGDIRVHTHSLSLAFAVLQKRQAKYLLAMPPEPIDAWQQRNAEYWGRQ
jgi:hypothetical protein